MADVRPFRALRYNTDIAGSIAELVCPPYDIISDAQREEYLRRSPRNIIRLELPKGEDCYAESGRTLAEWMAGGVLKRDGAERFYVYEEEFTAYGKKYKLNGIIGLVRLEEFDKGIVLPHEETLSKAKTDRFNLMSATYCNFSQIYSLYDGSGAVGEIISEAAALKPEADFAAGDGVRHRLWSVGGAEQLAAISKEFRERPLFIADGHHRYETALNFRNRLRENGEIKDDEHPGNFVMMMFVDMNHPGLVVFPTHRLVRGLASFDGAALAQSLEGEFDVQKLEMPGGENRASGAEQAAQSGGTAFAMYCGGVLWRLVLRDKSALDRLLPDMSPAYRSLDVTALHSLILERRLGIDKENMAKQINLTYTRDAAEALASVDSGESQCCFILNATKVSQIRDVALSGEKMPQKSTYFYPKLITGLVMNSLRP